MQSSGEPGVQLPVVGALHAPCLQQRASRGKLGYNGFCRVPPLLHFLLRAGPRLAPPYRQLEMACLNMETGLPEPYPKGWWAVVIDVSGCAAGPLAAWLLQRSQRPWWPCKGLHGAFFCLALWQCGGWLCGSVVVSGTAAGVAGAEHGCMLAPLLTRAVLCSCVCASPPAGHAAD